MVLKHEHFGSLIRNTWNVRNVMLERDGEDQLDRLCEKCRSVMQS